MPVIYKQNCEKKYTVVSVLFNNLLQNNPLWSMNTIIKKNPVDLNNIIKIKLNRDISTLWMQCN
jgi:hypothetical protein